jgi:inorganic pyrophosphatase
MITFKLALQGFAIGSAALVSLALFGAFVSRAGITDVNVLNPKVFVGLLVGAMLPYWFSAMTMKSVGSAALKMVEEVRRQFIAIPGLMEGRAAPDYARCVRISTDASLKEMMPPGALVLLAPLVAGTFFGVSTLAGLLAGALVSGVQVYYIWQRIDLTSLVMSYDAVPFHGASVRDVTFI